MKQSELKTYRGTLLRRLAELVTAVRDDRQDLAIAPCSDALDEVQAAAEREIAIRKLDRDSHLLREVAAALDRIDNGTYGVCQNCGKAIYPKRLNAVPWAPLCISCQEQADRNREDGGHLELELELA